MICITRTNIKFQCQFLWLFVESSLRCSYLCYFHIKMVIYKTIVVFGLIIYAPAEAIYKWIKGSCPLSTMLISCLQSLLLLCPASQLLHFVFAFTKTPTLPDSPRLHFVLHYSTRLDSATSLLDPPLMVILVNPCWLNTALGWAVSDFGGDSYQYLT